MTCKRTRTHHAKSCACDECLGRYVEQARFTAEGLVDQASLSGRSRRRRGGRLETALGRALFCLADVAFLVRGVKSRVGKQLAELIEFIGRPPQEKGRKERSKE